jgi:hypothetical protein
MNKTMIKMIRHDLTQKCYIVHNTTQKTYTVFLTPDDDEKREKMLIEKRKFIDVLLLRTVGDHVETETALFQLQPDECLVLHARKQLTECTPLNHVCVLKQNGEWLKEQKKWIKGKEAEHETTILQLG